MTSSGSLMKLNICRVLIDVNCVQIYAQSGNFQDLGMLNCILIILSVWCRTLNRSVFQNVSYFFKKNPLSSQFGLFKNKCLGKDKHLDITHIYIYIQHTYSYFLWHFLSLNTPPSFGKTSFTIVFYFRFLIHTLRSLLLQCRYVFVFA